MLSGKKNDLYFWIVLYSQQMARIVMGKGFKSMWQRIRGNWETGAVQFWFESLCTGLAGLYQLLHSLPSSIWELMANTLDQQAAHGDCSHEYYIYFRSTSIKMFSLVVGWLCGAVGWWSWSQWRNKAYSIENKETVSLLALPFFSAHSAVIRNPFLSLPSHLMPAIT